MSAVALMVAPLPVVDAHAEHEVSARVLLGPCCYMEALMKQKLREVKMRYLPFLVSVVLASMCVTPSTLDAQSQADGPKDTLWLDFNKSGRRRIEKDKPYQVVILNVIPRLVSAYWVTEERNKLESIPEPIPFLLDATKLDVPCQESALADLNRVDSESDVEPTILAVLSQYADCDHLMEFVRTATALTIGVRTLGEDEELKIRVRRQGGEAHFKLSTAGRGDWLVHYGFTFTLRRDESYYSRVNPDATQGGFIITKEETEPGLDIAPSILVSWLPSSSRGRGINFALSTGIGYNFDDPQLFLGLGASYNVNVMVTSGVVLTKVKRLDGRFTEGETIQENLDSDKFTSSVYKPNWYIGIAFRFGGNPFQSSGGDSEGG